MATTFHVTNFKNKALNMLTGFDAYPTSMGYIIPWNGAQPADPSVLPAGTAEFASIANAIIISTKMSAAGGGVSQLATPAAPAAASGAAAVSGLTFARLYTAGQTAIIDTSVSLVGGGGGVILDSLTSNAGIGNNANAFSLKMPNSLGTLLLSQSLADRLVDLWCTAGSVTPNFGNITGGGCTVNLYSGAAPSTADAPVTGTLLATYSTSGTNLWAAASGGASALAAAGPAATASATGTASYFRMVKTNGGFTFTLQGSVGTTAGATDMILNTVALTAGVTSVQVTDFTISI